MITFKIFFNSILNSKLRNLLLKTLFIKIWQLYNIMLKRKNKNGNIASEKKILQIGFVLKNSI